MLTQADKIAHDFNNIMMTLLGLTDLAIDHIDQDQPKVNGEVKKYLVQIRQIEERATSAARAILSFSKQNQEARETLHLSTLLKETVTLLRLVIPETIQLMSHWDESVWPVDADPTQMHQILMNLCINGADAMPEGGVLTVTISNRKVGSGEMQQNPELPHGDYVCLSVRDTGIGMDEETRQCIFEPFFTTKEPGKGTGLGLSIVDGVVKDHDGHVLVSTQEGKGTLFEVLLPRSQKKHNFTETITQEA